jgi:hypothetical protein
MTSLKQIEANRVMLCTTAHGRDGDRGAGGCQDYKAFEAAITADYDAQSAVEREWVLRHHDGSRPVWNTS